MPIARERVRSWDEKRDADGHNLATVHLFARNAMPDLNCLTLEILVPSPTVVQNPERRRLIE